VDWIETERLRWIPWTIEVMDAFIAGRPEWAERVLGVRIPPGFPNDAYREALPWFREQLLHAPLPWDGIVATRRDRMAIGTMGFRVPDPKIWVGAPEQEPLVMELGYGLLPQFWNQGYATEMGRAVVQWAFAERGVSLIVAGCAWDNAASARVLEKVGFLRTGQNGEFLQWGMARP
jgi:ribosomal-protein-alanine N-acetyltransferase